MVPFLLVVLDKIRLEGQLTEIRLFRIIFSIESFFTP